jgi:LPXTG-motif cell wall-anchored protein
VPNDSDDLDRPTAMVDRAMHVGEGVVYAVVGVLLVLAAVCTLVAVGWELVQHLDEGTLDAVTGALDGMLLVFILVELLGAVRATVRERKLVAEPFLVVGIIASIKEIVVVSLKAGDQKGEAFTDSMTAIAVLAGVTLLLGLTSFLVRRKEREPEER